MENIQTVLGVLVEAESSKTVASPNKGSSLMIEDPLDIMFQSALPIGIDHICRPLESLTQALGFCCQLSDLEKHFLKLFNCYKHVHLS